MFTKHTITITIIAVLAVITILALGGCGQNSTDSHTDAGIEIRYCSN